MIEKLERSATLVFKNRFSTDDSVKFWAVLSV